MKKKTNFFDHKSVLITLSICIIIILLILGLSFPKGITGIKPLKTVTYIVQQNILEFQYTESSKPSNLFKIFIILLIVLTIIYLVLNPSKAVAYIFATIFLISFFLIIPKIIEFLEPTEKLKQITIDKSAQNINLGNKEDSENKLEVLPYEHNENKSSYKLLYIILYFFLSAITLFVVLIFLINVIKRIIFEIKEGKFGFYCFNKRSKKTLINEISNVMNDTIDLIDTKNNIRDAIINCYLALLYSVKKYAKKIKDPSLTCREFEPVLLSLGLDISDINTLTIYFEKAKYSNSIIQNNEKKIVMNSLKNCVIKLKKMI